jgi:hypothetical protein
VTRCGAASLTNGDSARPDTGVLPSHQQARNLIHHTDRTTHRDEKTMNTTIVYGFCLTVCLALGAAMTSAATQSTLLVLTVSSGIALALTSLVELSGNRAQRKARGEYVARYGQDPWNGRR